MSRDDFIEACTRMGYCRKEVAEEYAGDREEFTDDDFIDAYRRNEAVRRHGHDRMHGFQGCRTTYRAWGSEGNSGRYQDCGVY